MNSIWTLRLLRLICLLALVGSALVLTQSQSSELALAHKHFRAILSKYQSVQNAKTPHDVEEARLAAAAEWAKAAKAHEQAFKDQEDLFFWPEEVENEFNFRSGLFAQRITVYLGAAKMPENDGADDRLLQGTVIEPHPNYLVVEDADMQRHKVYASKKVENNVKVEGAPNTKVTSFKSILVGDRVRIAFHRGKYFYEPLTEAELKTYKEPVHVYLKQIDPIISQVEPMDEKGHGVVQLKGPLGWFVYDKEELMGGRLPQRFAHLQKFLVCLERGWDNVAGDISEEAWLAQEDLWIQKEIYRLIRAANDSVSRFDKIHNDGDGDGLARPHAFRNSTFELGLSVKTQDDGHEWLTIDIKNLENRRQGLDFKIRIQFTKNGKPEVIDICEASIGPHGAADGERTVVRQLCGNPGPQGIYAVEQVLTWKTAAVKRIDAVNIGTLAPDEYSHSHRTFVDNQISLRPPALFKVRRRWPHTANEFTKHYLIRNRYWPSLNPALRRVPVSLVLIVHPDHVDRVLTVFNNSPLRFLTTQFLLNRYPGTLQPELPELADKKTGRFSSPPPSTANGFPKGAEFNLELVLYGIMTLYERYPPPLE